MICPLPLPYIELHSSICLFRITLLPRATPILDFSLYFLNRSALGFIYNTLVQSGRDDRDRMVVGFITTCATINVVSSNPAQMGWGWRCTGYTVCDKVCQ